MKRLVSCMLTLALLFSLLAVSAQAEGTRQMLLDSFVQSRLRAREAAAETIEEDGFVCTRLRNGNLKLIAYTGDGAGKTVNIPTTIKGFHVERIGEYAFDGCKMTGVTIPDTVEVIESFAFNDCTEIQKITIPNSVTFIDGNPFTGCKKLVKISVDPTHPTMQVITNEALYSTRNKMLLCYPCSNTNRSFSVPSGTISIGKNAFFCCDALESITLPDTVKEIRSSAFLGCENLNKISLPESILSMGELAFAGCRRLKEITIPQQIQRLETGVFYQCESLARAAFSENLTYIGAGAFFGCTSLGEIRLPENMNTIGENAFYGCSALTAAYIPVSVTEIGDSAFDACSIRLSMYVSEHSYAELYARLYDIDPKRGNEDEFLKNN